MDDRESTRSASSQLGLAHFVRRLRRWWRSQEPQARYLAAATDCADLERRIRVLERGNRPAFAACARGVGLMRESRARALSGTCAAPGLSGQRAGEDSR